MHGRYHPEKEISHLYKNFKMFDDTLIQEFQNNDDLQSVKICPVLKNPLWYLSIKAVIIDPAAMVLFFNEIAYQEKL